MSTGAVAEFETDLIERSRAWVAASAGELSRAAEILTAAAAAAQAAQLRVAQARLLHDLARMGRPREVAPRLAQPGQVMQQPRLGDAQVGGLRRGRGRGEDLPGPR